MSGSRREDLWESTSSVRPRTFSRRVFVNLIVFSRISHSIVTFIRVEDSLFPRPWGLEGVVEGSNWGAATYP